MRQGDFLPAPRQEWLLKAALLSGAQARQAWDAWIAAADLERLEPGSDWILPQLWANLRADPPPHPAMQRIRGIYRHAWLKSRLALSRIAAAAQQLRAAGIPVLVLSGAALAARYERAGGMRRLEDTDLLVPAEQARQAMRVLGGLGWAPAGRGADSFTPATLAARHAHPFVNDQDRLAFELHWRALPDPRGPDADADLWRNAAPLALDGVAVLALDSTDQLLHTCARGARWAPARSCRWVADAAMLLRGADIDWERLAYRARARRASLPLAAALAYLRQLLGVGIPLSALDALRAIPVTQAELNAYQAESSAPRGPWPAGAIRTAWARYQLYSESTGAPGGPRRAIGFPAYLKAWYGGAKQRVRPYNQGSRSQP
jgi:hypothetical protein